MSPLLGKGRVSPGGTAERLLGPSVSPQRLLSGAPHSTAAWPAQSYCCTKPRLILLQNTWHEWQDGDSTPGHHSPAHSTLHRTPANLGTTRCTHTTIPQPVQHSGHMQNPKEDPRWPCHVPGDTSIPHCALPGPLVVGLGDIHGHGWETQQGWALTQGAGSREGGAGRGGGRRFRPRRAGSWVGGGPARCRDRPCCGKQGVPPCPHPGRCRPRGRAERRQRL